MISMKELYTTVSQMVIQMESISWNRFYNFLMGNSILILAWATMYASTKSSLSGKIVMLAICLLGGITGVMWSDLGKRSRQHLELYFDQVSAIEKKSTYWKKGIPNKIKPFYTSTELRKSASWYSTNPFILRWVPLFFTVLYLLMLFTTFTLL